MFSHQQQQAQQQAHQQQQLLQQQQQQQQPVYIVQDPGVTSITLHPGSVQTYPIIDCRNLQVTSASAQQVKQNSIFFFSCPYKQLFTVLDKHS